MAYLNTVTRAYPVSEPQIRAEYPQTSFGTPFVAPEPYAWVFPAPRPEHNALSQSVREIEPAMTQLGHYEQRWEVLNLPSEQITANLNALKTRSVVAIDREVDAIYQAALGNRGPEYTDAEAAAVAYQAAGYTGTVPPDVQSWVTAKGWTATQAADDILAAAVQLRTAKSAIRAQRLLRKEQVRAAADGAAVGTAMAQWAGFVTAIKAQLGV